MGSSTELESEKVGGFVFFAGSHGLEESSSRAGAGARRLERCGWSESDSVDNSSRALPGGGESSPGDSEDVSKRLGFFVIER